MYTGIRTPKNVLCFSNRAVIGRVSCMVSRGTNAATAKSLHGFHAHPMTPHGHHGGRKHQLVVGSYWSCRGATSSPLHTLLYPRLRTLPRQGRRFGGGWCGLCVICKGGWGGLDQSKTQAAHTLPYGTKTPRVHVSQKKANGQAYRFDQEQPDRFRVQ